MNEGMPPSATTPELRAAFSELCTWEPVTRARGAARLGHMGEVAVPPLGDILTGRHSPGTRLAAIDALRQIGAPAAPMLLDTFLHGDARLSQPAVAALADIPGREAAHALLRVLADAGGRAPATRVSVLSRARPEEMRIVAAALAAALLIGLAGSPFLPVMGVAALFAAVAIAAQRRSPAEGAAELRRLALGGLARSHDPDAIAPAVRLLDTRVHEAAVDALTEVLPYAAARAADPLPPDAMAALLRELRVGEVRLKLAILGALGHIGDYQALTVVEEIVRGDHPAGRHARLRAAAEECLPLLRERVALLRRAKTLLRPADGGDATDLLRPATSGEEDSQQLLRPSEDA